MIAVTVAPLAWFVERLAGGAVEVETLHDREKLRVPPGTSPGHEFRLRGKGVTRLNKWHKGFGALERARAAVVGKGGGK